MRLPALVIFLALSADIILRAAPLSELTVEASPDREFYRADTTNKIHLAIRLGSQLPTATTSNPEIPASPDAPHGNFAFVLDRSGSMAGEPIEALRGALTGAIRSLNDADLVSIVVFGSEIETLLPATPRGQLPDLDALLARIEPGGGSALYDALNQGAAQLRRFAGPATGNHLILLTDGPATKGPREPEDFTKLGEAFAREYITLSAIGLGPDFDEDLLTALARAGRGDFRYAEQPAALAAAIGADLASHRLPVARDVELTIRFAGDAESIAVYGWHEPTLAASTASYAFPVLYAGQEANLLLSATIRARRNSLNIASLRLRWQDPATGKARELTRSFEAYFENDNEAVRRSQVPAANRITTRTLISEGFQKAIEWLDRGDPRRAARALRTARADALSINYELDDPVISAQVRALEAYLAEAESRGLGSSDRKMLRSGLAGRFDPPVVPPGSTKAKIGPRK